MNCTGCGMGLAPGQAFCTRCGTPVPAQAPTAAPANFCTACGTTLQAGAAFCVRCGHPVSGAGTPTGAPGGAPDFTVPESSGPVMAPEDVPAYHEAADIVGAHYDPHAEQLFLAAVQSMGGELLYEEPFRRWSTLVGFPDGRTQRVFLYLEEPNDRGTAYVGAGQLLVTVASNAGPDTEVVDAWMVFRRAAQLYLTRVVSDSAPWGATLRVRGSLLFSTATPGLVSGMIQEAAAEADTLEEAIFGSAVDED